MPLVLESILNSKLPIEVEGIIPESLVGMSSLEIAKQQIWHGNEQIELAEAFRLEGSLEQDCSLIWTGRLNSVHWIGQGMTDGKIVIESDVGRHVGSGMRGGTIHAQSNVSDFVGCEMTGGTIQIQGDCADHVGGCYPGSKFGMNRGEILVRGSVGRAAGHRMRRGTIAIGGDAGDCCGWSMLAGTIVAAGTVGRNCGAAMTRGTIVVGKPTNLQLLPSFSEGGIYHDITLQLVAKWLLDKGFEPASNLVSRSHYQMFCGDRLNGGRGEIFVPSDL